jgi:dTMP kinase
MSSPGRFITFEGIEGTGKSTQLLRLATRLERSGVEVVATREPGGTELGAGLRALLLRPCASPISPLAELLLYAADRAQHLAEVVEPGLRRGAVVLCDRYVDATLAYQGHGRGLDPELILALHRRATLDRLPDRTVLLVLEPGLALRRALARNASAGRTDEEDRFEQEGLEFQRRVAAGYLDLARSAPDRFRIVDGRGSPEDVEQRVHRSLSDVLPPC